MNNGYVLWWDGKLILDEWVGIHGMDMVFSFFFFFFFFLKIQPSVVRGHLGAIRCDCDNVVIFP